jgi:hypothetical protein
MKKLTFCITTAFLLLSFIPFQLKAEAEKTSATIVTTKTVESTDVNAAEIAKEDAQLARLEEIRTMDMSNLTPAEKKELREEVHSIQNAQDDHYMDRDRDHHDRDHRHHHGMYFGIGGGLLLIVLLILLLG